MMTVILRPSILKDDCLKTCSGIRQHAMVVLSTLINCSQEQGTSVYCNENISSNFLLLFFFSDIPIMSKNSFATPVISQRSWTSFRNMTVQIMQLKFIISVH